MSGFRYRSGWLAALAILVGVLALKAASPAGSKERLRRLARLPYLHFNVGLNFDPASGIGMTTDPSEARREVEELERGLAGSADAGRYRREGRLYRELGDFKQARLAFSKAVELCRQQGGDQADDGVLLADYGEALAGLGQREQAERTLRRAVKIAPREWRAQAALGRFLSEQSLRGLASSNTNLPAFVVLRAMAAGVTSIKPAPERLEQAQKTMGEALACWGRAVELAPQEPDLRAGAAAAKAARSLLQAIIDAAGGAVTDPAKVAHAFYPREALPDLQEAARLSPRNPRVIGTAVLFELFAFAAERGATHTETMLSGDAWDAMPDHLRDAVRTAMGRLDGLSQKDDPSVAAGAFELLGTLQLLVMHDTRSAETSLRQAVSLDPRRDQAWEALVFTLANARRFEDLQSVCESLVREKDTPRHRVMLAKAYEQLNRLDRTLEEAETAQRRYPDDFYTNLTLAAALLRTDDGEPAITRAGQFLAKAEKIAGDAPARDQVAELLFLRGLYYALSAQREPALANLRQLLELEKDHAGAKEAVEILEQAG